RRVTTTIIASAGLQTLILPHGLRLRHSGNTTFIFNYGRETHDLKKLGFKGPYGLDGSISAPAGVSTILA
ncbi:MAG: hypothetical protein M3O03_02015, partial [Pseudomonadota bacterium]|nr:hypothetical protein [Pseudomonadota bacterium]